jgi:putative membrane-bound dehydrogenase-like protein
MERVDDQRRRWIAWIVVLGWWIGSDAAWAQDPLQRHTPGNRLSYLDEPCDPYYVGQSFPKLVTPQWIGEEGVEAVVIFAIDDMRDPAHYESYLRPILDRLKEIDGRAAVSIMTNQVDPRSEQVAEWISEGLTLDIHTIDHPCPCLKDSDFAQSRRTYNDCVDLMFEVSGNRPTTFRMPCCDSLNTPSPRFWSEIFNRTTDQGKFLTADSSVFQIFTPDDPDLPADLLRDDDGQLKFEKYVPFPSFANTIRNYPYPYVINGICWEFPCMVPSDWQAQNLHQPFNPVTVEDLKSALDLTVLKQGTMNLVFHPHGWIRNDQMVELIDHAVEKHGRKVKFLTFADAIERLNKNLLSGTPLRDAQGRENPNRLMDLNQDGYIDVVQSNPPVTRIWHPANQSWTETATPFQVGRAIQDLAEENGEYSSSYVNRVDRYGVMGSQHEVVVSSLAQSDKASSRTLYRFRDGKWQQLDMAPPGSVEDETAGVAGLPAPIAAGVFRDVDGDGQTEWLQQNSDSVEVYAAEGAVWKKLGYTVPAGWRLFPTDWRLTDSGLRFIDLNSDGREDVVASDESRYGAWLFESSEQGWATVLRTGTRGDDGAIPPVARNQRNNGAWFQKDTIWVQNEDTARLPNLVDRLSFSDLLASHRPQAKNQGLPLPREPESSRQSMRVAPGFEVELVAAEPLIADPVAFDWGPDGRLWVAEMSDYPLGVDGKGEPGGRVRVLTDTDGDGRYDHSIIFADKLPFPTGVKVWKDRVLISTAPDVLAAIDLDGDQRADRIEPIFRGFAEGNQQHRVNGLQYGLDHRLYLANGDSGGEISSVKTGQSMNIRGRDLWVHPDTGAMGTTSGQTQFGRNRDDWQHWFGGNNSNPMWHYVIEDHYLARNPHVSYPSLRQQVSVQPGASPVFPLSQTLERFNDLQMANRFTSACSPNIYRDQRLGESMYGNAFICEPVHNLVHREIMTPEGASWTSQRPEGEVRSEFLASRDSWFRPVMIRTAPDGSLWVADMYRLVIEHPEWITPERQAQMDLRSGHDRGRIYRIKKIGHDPQTIKSIDSSNVKQCVEALDSSNGWVRDMGQQLLVWGKYTQAAPELRQRLRQHPQATTRLQALATLAALNSLSVDDLVVGLQDPHPGVRRWAVRCSEPWVEQADVRLALADLVETEEDKQVLLQLACSLGEGSDPKLADLLAQVMASAGDDPWIRAACSSSIRQDTVARLLQKLFVDSQQPVSNEMGQLVLESAAGWMSTDEFGQLLEAWLPQDLSQVSIDPEKTSWWQALVAWQEHDRGLPVPVQDWLDQQRPWARKQLDSGESSIHQQSVAVAILGFGRQQQKEDLERMLNALAATAPTPLRDRALRVVQSLEDVTLAEGMIGRWRQLSPATRQQVTEMMLTRPSWTQALVDALKKGEIATRELGLTAASRLRQVRDEKLRVQVEELLSQVTESQRGEVIARYLKEMPASGDPVQGRGLFQQQCASCHRVANLGEQLGPDLAALTDKTTPSLVTAILDPNRAIEDKYLQYVALTEDGLQIAGVIVEESSASVTLAAADGKQHQIRRADLSDLVSTQQSLMPEGLERELKPQQLTDLIAFLREDIQPAKQFPGNDPQTMQADDLGVVRLPAKHARIYGPQMVFEAQYQNLGWWSDPKDHAIWNLLIEQPGVYRVILDYASAPGADGDALELIVGGQKLGGIVKATKGWDDYADLDLGKVQLDAGQWELVVRPQGSIKTALIDLRTVKLIPVVE